MIRVVVVALALLTASPAWSDGFRPPALPAHLLPTSLSHVPQPFPEDGELDLQDEGPSGWIVGAGVLGAGSAVAGLVTATAHARVKDEASTVEQVERGKRTREVAGYSALAALGGVGVCLVLNRVW